MLLKDEARKFADSVRESYWDEVFPVDPAAIARSMGVKVNVNVLPPDTSGMIVKNTGDPAEIFLQASDTPPRQRFTTAHELGHFMERTWLRPVPDDKFSFVERRGGEMTLHEFFANEFAGNLLMPEHEVRRLQADGAEPVRMAAHFGVSAPAMRLRLKRLG